MSGVLRTALAAVVDKLVVDQLGSVSLGKRHGGDGTNQLGCGHLGFSILGGVRLTLVRFLGIGDLARLSSLGGRLVTLKLTTASFSTFAWRLTWSRVQNRTAAQTAMTSTMMAAKQMSSGVMKHTLQWATDKLLTWDFSIC